MVKKRSDFGTSYFNAWESILGHLRPLVGCNVICHFPVQVKKEIPLIARRGDLSGERHGLLCAWGFLPPSWAPHLCLTDSIQHTAPGSALALPAMLPGPGRCPNPQIHRPGRAVRVSTGQGPRSRCSQPLAEPGAGDLSPLPCAGKRLKIS